MWLAKELSLQSRASCVVVGQQLLEASLIAHVSGGACFPFLDDKTRYKFLQENTAHRSLVSSSPSLRRRGTAEITVTPVPEDQSSPKPMAEVKDGVPAEGVITLALPESDASADSEELKTLQSTHAALARELNRRSRFLTRINADEMYVHP